jgi:hypothetical protein
MSARDSRRGFLMGQRVGLSFLDSKLANLGYHCSDNCNPKPECENEGYVDQNCQCACPDGFYGDHCDFLQGYICKDIFLYLSVNIIKLLNILSIF